MSRKHHSIPIAGTATGVAHDLRSQAKHLRAEFDKWRAKYEAEIKLVKAQRDELIVALEKVDEIACRSASGNRPDDPPEPANRDGEELAAVARAAIAKARGA